MEKRVFLKPMVFACIYHNGWHHFAWLRYTEIRKVSRSDAKEKRERLNVGEEDWGVIASKIFQALARTHIACVLVGRDDPPTHSCRRSVVDDNGNPIFRNNICLEDRRLKSCDADVYTSVFVCARVCTKCSLSAVTSVVLSIFFLTLESWIEKNKNRH